MFVIDMCFLFIAGFAIAMFAICMFVIEMFFIVFLPIFLLQLFLFYGSQSVLLVGNISLFETLLQGCGGTTTMVVPVCHRCYSNVFIAIFSIIMFLIVKFAIPTIENLLRGCGGTTTATVVIAVPSSLVVASLCHCFTGQFFLQLFCYSFLCYFNVCYFNVCYSHVCSSPVVTSVCHCFPGQYFVIPIFVIPMPVSNCVFELIVFKRSVKLWVPHSGAPHTVAPLLYWRPP